MTDRTRNIMVGLTALAGMASLAILLMLFGYLPTLLSPGYAVKARIADSQGINDASRVWLYGIDIGRVEKIELLPFPQRGVQLTLRIRQDVRLPEGTVASVNAPLLGGTPSISLDTSQIDLEQESLRYLPTDGSAALHTDLQPSSLESRVAQELRSALESAAGSLQSQFGSRLDKFDKLADQLDELAVQWIEVGRNVNQITSPRNPADVDAGKQPGNLASAVARLDQRVADLKDSLDAIGQWTGDETLRADIKAAAANARSLTEKFDTSLDQISDVAAKAEGHMEKLANRFIASADDLSGSIQTLQSTLTDLRQGKGTLGKLLNDPAAYDNLNDAFQRVGLAADEMKILLEKWRKEGLPLQF